MKRRTLTIIGLVGAVVAGAAPASAHGIGGRSDLPVPVSYFIVGGAIVLALSFAALAVLWPVPRLQAVSKGRIVGRWRRGPVVVLAVIGLIGLALTIGAGIIGEDRRTNAAPVLLWVYFILVIPFLGAVFGDLYRHINPWRTMAGDRTRPAFPAVTALGVWPAAAAFVAFTWFELVHRDSANPVAIGTAALIYSLYLGGAVVLTDKDRAFATFDAFTSYNAYIGAIAPLELDAHGYWTWHGWLRRLPQVPAYPGMPVFVAAMIGTVTYDGLSATEWWGDTWDSTANEEWFGTLALVATVAVIYAAYWLASWGAARAGGSLSASQVASSFAHTLVPIALAYAVAHYFTLIIFEGQLAVAVASDPLGLGSDFFGTAANRINFWLSPTSIWYVQLTAILGGHVAAIVLAHDRALAVFPKERAVRSQYAMLGLMVALTGLGLALLAAG